MKMIIKSVIFIIVAVLLAIFIRSAGRVVILYGDYKIDLSLIVFVIIDLLIFISLYWIIRIWVILKKYYIY